MMKHAARRLALVLFALPVLLAGCAEKPARPVFGEGPRRILVVSLDCLRADGLACYGNPRPVSPRLDALAAEGLRFDHATCPGNWTLPSHASLFTGIYPTHHGLELREAALSEEVGCLTEQLQAAGFATGSVNGGAFLRARYGYDRGFDHWASMPQLDRELEEVLKQSREWLSEHRDQDVFFFLHTYEIHAPYTPPKPYIRRALPHPRTTFQGHNRNLKELKERGATADEIYDVRGHYDAGILYTDEKFGEFMDWLAAEGLDENLLLIVASDHGEQFWEHGEHGHGKNMLGPELTDVPLIVRLPGGAGAWPELAGGVRAEEVSFLDVMPTVLDAAGLPRPPGIDGFSLLPEITGAPVSEVDAVARARRTVTVDGEERLLGLTEGLYWVSVRAGQWKAVLPRPGRPVRSERYGPFLFDLAADPGQLEQGAMEGPVAEALQDALAGLIRVPERPHQPNLAPVDEETKRQLEALGY